MRRRQIQQEYMDLRVRQEQEEFKKRNHPPPRIKQEPGMFTCPWCLKEFKQHGAKVHIMMNHSRESKKDK